MQGKYFDGKTSKAHVVDVSKSSDHIRITFINDYSRSAKNWNRANVTVESFSSSDKVLLSFGEFPFERVELEGQNSAAYVEFVNDKKILAQSYQKITKAEPVKLVLLSLATLALVVYSYVFWVSPYVGEKVVEVLPIDVEVKVGNVMYNNMSSFFTQDSAKSELLNEFFDVCGFESEYPIRIEYADDDMVNAFAVPGGRILIYRGIIEEMESWEELAALMGHELAHVNERHSFKQIARSLSGYLIVSVLTGDVAGASSIILDNAYQIHELAYSRSHEKDADMKGLLYLKELEIRPDAMVDLFTRLDDLSQLSEDLNKGLEFMSTHPSSTNRMKYLLEQISSNDEYNYQDRKIERAIEIWDELKSEQWEQEEEQEMEQEEMEQEEIEQKEMEEEQMEQEEME